MKRLLTLFCALLLVTSVSAQRVAVLEFTAGSGVSQADIDGVASIFNTYFTPNGYTLVERIQIERVISEQNLQKDKITQAQMVRIGEILNVSVIVTGKINIHAGEYNIDVQALNVESGVLCGKAGITWKPDSSYRNAMKQLALDLADQIAIKPIEPVIEKKNNIRKRTEVEVVLGYLKVYPTELGVFPSAPNTVIAQINRQHLYDYDTWRIPTIEELALLRANDYLSDETYISSSTAKSSGIVLLVTDDNETYSQKQARLAQEANIRKTQKQNTTTEIVETIVATTTEDNNTEVVVSESTETKTLSHIFTNMDKEFTIMGDLDFAFGGGLVLGSPFVTIGGTLNDRVFLGAGTGFLMDFWNDIYLPLYFNTRVYFTKNTFIRPYISASIGAELTHMNIYIIPALGIEIPFSKKIDIYLSAGPEITNDEKHYDLPLFSLKLGLRF
ncbi:MAG: hypothetical protein IIU78_05055 [Alistipes sp.]|nr:hypothetical protein [Alistipes sp.]